MDFLDLGSNSGWQAPEDLAQPPLGGGWLGGQAPQFAIDPQAIARASPGVPGIGWGNKAMGFMNRLGAAMFPIDPRLAKVMTPAQLHTLQSQAMMKAGLGMMAAARSPGANLGSSLAAGVLGSQEGLQRDALLSRELEGADYQRTHGEQREAVKDQQVQQELDQRAEQMRELASYHMKELDVRERELQLRGQLGSAEGQALAFKKQQIGAAVDALSRAGLSPAERARAEAVIRSGGDVGPMLSPGKPTNVPIEEQKQVAAVNRLAELDQAMRNFTYSPRGVGGVTNSALGAIPMGVGKVLQSDPYKQHQALEDEFIDLYMQIKPSTGSRSLRENKQFIRDTYLDQPTDTQAVRQRKEVARAGIIAEAQALRNPEAGARSGLGAGGILPDLIYDPGTKRYTQPTR